MYRYDMAMGAKSTVITYLLWITVGWLGAHHFYLRRYRHGFVWLWTLGGCCGLGWLLEFWRLPCYVDIANSSGMCYRHKAGVSFSWKTFSGALAFSMLLGVLSSSAIPNDILKFCPLLASVAALFIAAGVHTVVNIDNDTRCSYMWCLLGACVPLPIIVFSSKLDTFLTYSCLSSVAVAHMYGMQSRQPKRGSTGRTQSLTMKDTCHAWLCVSAANLLMIALFTSALYYNCYVTTRDGVQVPLKDAFRNMLESPAWAEFRRTVRHLFHCLIHEGLHKFVYEFRIVLDPEGENSAYKLLGFTDSSPVSEQQLTERYRQLVRQFHPDKVPATTELERKDAERRFIAIQQAYERLSAIKRRRADRTEL